ncbi:uncharacterized protein EV420DRAFT_1618469 [Desarmillaria tabescens]|uniref:BTB domain-containing protein n=1 Tax=Armillaria tabescens TaxID=1929756 RepID=A0AA39TVM0_ARMTA|nr:uncharacterized protein EV420DRAFT_1618469 [Desarmillaria tabescens]KAK0464699.1 hypothetical protein EV420DRAFT_1618469 [Desarmillaria tabescens]
MSFPNCSTIGIRRYKVFPGQDTRLSFSETPISSKLTRMDHSLPDQPSDYVSSVSTKFGPGFEFRGVTSDVQLVSWDSVLFHVHRDRLLEASFNGFDGLLCVPEPRVVVPETSNLLNIILHAIYDISCSPFQPSIDTLMDAVCLFPKYGLRAKDYISPSLPLFNDIRYRMPLSPLLTFVVSSNHGLEDLAVLASAHLLALDISTMSDNMVETINPVYLKRLFDLQTSRVNAFKRLLSVPPESHPATPECDFIAQKSLTRSWAFYTAYMLWDVRADMTAGMIERTFETLDSDLLCSLCKNCLRKRVKSIVIEWSELKVGGS